MNFLLSVSSLLCVSAVHPAESDDYHRPIFNNTDENKSPSSLLQNDNDEDFRQTLQDLQYSSGLQKCQTDAEDPACQQARYDAMLAMEGDQNNIDSMLSETQAVMESLQSQVDQRSSDVNNLIMGVTGGGYGYGLIVSLGRIASAVTEVQTALQGQSTALQEHAANQVQTLDAELDNIKTVLDTQFANLEQGSEQFINQQTVQQHQALDNTVTAFNEEVDSVANQAESVASAVENEINAEDQRLVNFDSATTQETQELSGELDDMEDEIITLNSQMETAMNDLDRSLTAEWQNILDDVEEQADIAYDSSQQSHEANVQQSMDENVNTVNSDDEALRAGDDAMIALLSSGADRLEDEIKSSAESTEALIRLLDEENNADLATIETEQMKKTDDINALTADNEAMTETLAQGLDDISSISTSEISQAAADIDIAITESRNEIASSQNQFADSVDNQFGDILRSISSLGDYVSNSIESNSASTGGELSVAKTTMGENSAKQFDAILSILELLQVSSNYLKESLDVSDGSVKNQMDLMDVLFGGEVDEIAKATQDLSNENAEMSTQIKNVISQYLSDSNSEWQKDFSQFNNENSEEYYNMENEQLSNAQQVQQWFASLDGTMEALLQGLQGASEDGTALQLASDEAGNLANQLFASLLSSIDLASSLFASESDEAEQQVLSNVQAQVREEEEDIGNLSQKLMELFGTSMQTISDEQSATLQELGENAQKEEHLMEQQQMDISESMQDIKNLIGEQNIETSLVEAELQRMAEEQGMSMTELIDAMKAEENRKLEEFEENLVKNVQDETEATTAATAELFEQDKTLLEELLTRLQEQGQESMTLQTEAEADAEGLQETSDKFNGDLDSAEETLDTQSATQFTKLDEFMQIVENWSIELEKKLAGAQSTLQQGMLLIPELSAEQAAGITKAMQDTQGNMQEYLRRFETAFDESQKAEAEYEKEQAMRTLAALLDIDEAVLYSQTGLLEELMGTEISDADAAKRMSEVLVGLADSVSMIKNNDADVMNKIKSEILNLDSNTGGLFELFKNNLNKEMSDMYHELQNEQNANDDKIHGYVLIDGKRIEGLGSSVSKILQNFHHGAALANMAMASDRKDIYALAGLFQTLGDDTRLELTKLLHNIESGEENLLSSIEKSRDVDYSQVTSVKDVVGAFVQVIEGYLAQSRHSFDNIRAKIVGFKDYLDNELDAADTQMLLLAESTQDAIGLAHAKQEALEKLINDFGQLTKKNLFDIQEEHAEMETRQENELNEIKNEVFEVTEALIDKQKATAQEIDGWMVQADHEMEQKIKSVEDKVTNAQFIEENTPPAEEEATEENQVSVAEKAKEDAEFDGWWASSFLYEGKPKDKDIRKKQ